MESLERRIESILADSPLDSASVAVASSEGRRFDRTYSRGPEPTAFQGSSISKPVAAFTTFRLADDGLIRLDVAVNEQLRTWELPARWTVTPLQLLSHSGGVTVSGIAGYPTAEMPTLSESLSGLGLHPPVVGDEEPDSGFRYSGGGYGVLQQLVEDVTGDAFGDVARDLTLAPLGMNASVFEPPSGHAWPRDERGERIADPWLYFPEAAAAGLWTTAGDLVRFASAIQARALLSTDAYAALLAPRHGRRGIVGMLEAEPPDRHFWHGGAHPGCRSIVVGYVDRPFSAAVLTASSAGSDLVTAVLAAVANELDWPAFVLPE